MCVVSGELFLEAHSEFAGDLALQDVAEDVVLDRRVTEIGNL